MVIDVQTNLDTEVAAELDKYDIDLRKAQRRVVKEAADEYMGHLRTIMRSGHEVSGNTVASLRSVPVNGGWDRAVRGSKVFEYLEEGTSGHPVNPEVLEQAAAQYGMTPNQLANIIFAFGTRRYEVLTLADQRTSYDSIVRRVLQQRGLI